MELNAKDLSLILGIKPDYKLDDITIVIKDKKSDKVLKELDIEKDFKGMYNLPINLDKI